jgi:DnaJ family protein C protein 28
MGRNMTDNKRTLRDWESAIDKQIREAMERGEFDNLPGAGKPLDLSDDPHTPDDWRMAFKILKDNKVAPGWIEHGKTIRDELRALQLLLDDQIRWQSKHRAKMKSLAPPKLIAEREHLAQARERVMRDYRQRAETLNRLIDTFNLEVPNVQLQLPRVRIDDELERFVEASK